MKIIYLLILINTICFFEGKAQLDSTSNSMAKGKYAFQVNDVFLTPSIAYAPDSKITTLGLEFELAAYNRLGFVGALGGTASKYYMFDPDSYSNELKRIYAGSFGLRFHTAYKASQKFDLMPGVFYSKVFGNYSDNVKTSAMVAAFEMRYLSDEKIGFTLGASRSLNDCDCYAFSFGIVSKLNKTKK